MDIITFPALGLKFNLQSIAFRFLGVDIYYYSICIVIGIVVAITLCVLSKEKFGCKFDELIDILIYTIVFGLIGARLFYIIFKLDYYLASPIRIFAIRDGGLAIYGGLILGSIALVVKSKMLKKNPYDILDYIAPFVAIAQSIGRWGNFFNKEAYGIQTNSLLRMGIFNLEGYIEVHPTFLYESISTFVIFCILRILQKNRKFNGQILLSYLILYSFARFFIENIRADSLMLGNFKISMLLSFIIFICSIALYLKINHKATRNTKQNVEKCQ